MKIKIHINIKAKKGNKIFILIFTMERFFFAFHLKQLNYFYSNLYFIIIIYYINI